MGEIPPPPPKCELNHDVPEQNSLVPTRTQHNKSLDASGGSVFLNLLGAAKGALNRAAASTQPFYASSRHRQMRLLLLSILIALSIASTASAQNSSAPRSIRDVDFKNFTFNWYPRDADTPPVGRKIVLTNGEMDTGWVGEERRTFFLINQPIKYGDLTGDGNEEAVVVLGTIISGMARPGVIFVYTI